MKIIGIGGGSGSGKSTVSYALIDARPDLFEVLNLDDYQKLKTDPNLPTISGMINWDHPSIIIWEKLIGDLKTLKTGKAVTIDSWAHWSNPDYLKTHRMIHRTILPKPILIVEGYLALYNQDLNILYDRKYYFDLDEKTRMARRNKNAIIAENSYEQKILKPMHRKFVEPTKNKADEIIQVSGKSMNEIKNYLLSQLI